MPILYSWGYDPFFLHPAAFLTGKVLTSFCPGKCRQIGIPSKKTGMTEKIKFLTFCLYRNTHSIYQEKGKEPSSAMVWALQFSPKSMGAIPTHSCFSPPPTPPSLLVHTQPEHMLCSQVSLQENVRQKNISLKLHDKVRSWNPLLQFYIHLQRGCEKALPPSSSEKGPLSQHPAPLHPPCKEQVTEQTSTAFRKRYRLLKIAQFQLPPHQRAHTDLEPSYRVLSSCHWLATQLTILGMHIKKIKNNNNHTRNTELYNANLYLFEIEENKHYLFLLLGLFPWCILLLGCSHAHLFVPTAVANRILQCVCVRSSVCVHTHTHTHKD